MENTTGEKTEAVKDSSNQIKIKVTEMEIGTEFERLMEIGDYYPLKKKRFDFGNGYLYLFCQEYPLPETIIEPDLKDSDCSGDSDMPTEQEAAFADQLWLIGRSYAASPERYRYYLKKEKMPSAKENDSTKNKKKPKTKPSDEWLGDEGYESFFGDITRILFRKECHDPDNPVAYLRGIKEKLEVDKIFDKNNQDIDKATVNLRNSFRTLDGFADFLRDVNELKKKSHFLFFDKRQTYEQSEIDILDDDLLITKQVADLVIRFAQLLNAARFVRDAAIIHRASKLDAATQKPAEDTTNKKSNYKYADILNKCKTIFGLGNPSLSISISSKFLHFHVPQFFFIYDSITSKKIGADEEINLALGSPSAYKNKSCSSSEIIEYKIFIELILDGTDKFIERIAKYFNNLDLKQQAVNGKNIKATKASFDPKFNGLNNEESTNGNRHIDYLVHATKELALAYAIHNYFLKHLNSNSENGNLYNQIIASLKRGTCNQDSGSSIPKPPYYSITRMIDLLVSNSNKGTNNTKGKGKNNNKNNSGSNVQSQ